MASFGTDESAGMGEPATVGERTGVARAPDLASGPAPRAGVTLDARRRQLIGVRMTPVERRSVARTIRAVGNVRADETRLSEINLKVDGWIRELYVSETGQPVRAGDALFTLYSPDLLVSQQEYLLALEARDVMRASQVPDAREYADRLVEAARERLALWDLDPGELQAIDESRVPRQAVVFRSPTTGYVLEKTVVQGRHVVAGQSLYQLADLSVVWIEASVYEQDLSLVRMGTRGVVRVDAYPGESFAARVVHIHPTLDEQTRSVGVRLTLDNPGGRLKPGMYAHVDLIGPAAAGLVIPPDALVDTGRRQLVFVAEGDGYFAPRDVTIGRRFEDGVEVLSGLAEGEQVAAGATFFLDSESQLRAAVQGFEASAPAAAGSEVERLAITFGSEPDPPRTGRTTFEVSLRTATGAPLVDAQVSVTLFMPAMPAMSMPAMRERASLAHEGGGVYRGTGTVPMAGSWQVTVDVEREGQRLGGQQSTLVAR
jgi:Cu(I)/Ag(I) efflux system membrane fusion protein/cobalt-zinc-cadmium efflux system membrane fusion protein